MTSLSESMNEMGVDDACVSKFADIFAWDINFFVDPKKGDSYEIIFEKKFSEGRFAGYGDILAAEYVNNGHPFRAIGLKDEKESCITLIRKANRCRSSFSRRRSILIIFHRDFPSIGCIRFWVLSAPISALIMPRRLERRYTPPRMDSSVLPDITAVSET